jgi:hypothetical protein
MCSNDSSSTSGVAGAIGDLADEDLRRPSDAALEEDLVEIERAMGRLEVERLRRVAEVDRRSSWRAFPSMETFLGVRLGIGRGAANRDLRRARALERMPRVTEALATGEISRQAMTILVAAREGREAAFAEAEPDLVEKARTTPIGPLYRATRYWRLLVDAMEDGDEAGAARGGRFLHASRTLFGMVRVDGELDPDAGECLLTALSAAVDAEVRSGLPDRRSPAQRRADAMAEICRGYLDRTDRPEVGGERPHVTVTADVVELIAAGTGGPRAARFRRDGDGSDEAEAEAEAEAVAVARRADRSGSPPGDGSPAIRTVRDLARRIAAAGDHVIPSYASGEPVGPAALRMIACDASVARVLLRGRSEVLDVGRRTPVVSAGIRRAVVARDRGCAFPGCDRPPTWCDAHHIQHWANGGRTALANLVLLCRRHHRMLHGRTGWIVSMREGRPEFRAPGDTPVAGRAPP